MPDPENVDFAAIAVDGVDYSPITCPNTIKVAVARQLLGIARQGIVLESFDAL